MPTMDDVARLNLEASFRGMMARSFDDPDAVCLEQENDMRRAFFGGAKATLDLLEHSGFNIRHLRGECRIYIDAVKAGRR